MKRLSQGICVFVIGTCTLLGSPRWFHTSIRSSSITSGALEPSSLPPGTGVSSKIKRELSMEERMRYQWAIERVYWEHKLWPAENQQPKPRFEEVLTFSAVWQKVEDTLRESNALEQRYSHRITAEQLQAEMDRIASQTRQPELLRELQEALDNDPYVIAECLARPLLVDRLIRNWYGSDQRLHAALRAQAESEVEYHRSTVQMKLMSGQYAESEWVREQEPLPVYDSPNLVERKLSPPEWTEAIGKLAQEFSEPGDPQNRVRCFSCSNRNLELMNQIDETDELQIDRISNLQEDNQRFYVTGVLARSDDRLRLATVEWRKTDFNKWWEVARSEFQPAIKAPVHQYELSRIAEVCVDDTWKQTKLIPEGVNGATAVWTGTEMIIWGGGVNTGARYNPATDSWVTMSLTDAPFRRISHTAVWTGTEMIVWGGCNTTGHLCGENSGGRYNPLTDSWRPTTTANAPAARRNHTAVWTGSMMIIWGGCIPSFDGRCPTINTGGVYNPATDSWTATTVTDAPSPRVGHTAVWSGSVMVIWGPTVDSTGGRYNPETNTWAPTSTINVPAGRGGHSAIWSGTEMIVWGGASGTALDTGGRYNPATDIWTPTSTSGAPAARYNHSAVWTGSEMIVWGGWDTGSASFNSGGRYNPATNTWTSTNTINAPSARAGHSAVWTGSLMVVWGGAPDKSGGRYDPFTDSWTPTNNNNTGERRNSHEAVWTGTEMLVWGGQGALSGDLNTGMLYSPATDSWRPTTTINAPSPRYSCRAVWTGLEMIVWGGGYISICGGPGTGGRYNPTTDVWSPISTAGAPENRGYHTAVWTGTEMVVWGGDCDSTFNTGGRYNPSSDTWRSTSTTNAPAARYLHSAVWSGSEMIVWGGVEFGTGVYFNTGGLYNPSTDTWRETNTASAPSARIGHTAVWTGSEMVVWGGWTYGTPSIYFNTGGRYNPATNTWQPTSTNSAPEARTGHTAVWTGSLMVVWGGVASQSSLGPIYSTGGRYNPATDAWAPTNTSGAPSGRDGHSAVWTGSEMIVWGGNYTASGARYCVALDPGFNISASSSSVTVTQGGTGLSVFTVSSLNGFSSAVNLGCLGTPAGVTWAFSPNPVTPPANGVSTSTLTLTVSSSVPPGMYWIPIVGTSGSLSRTRLRQLSVLAAGDFYVDSYPELISAEQGGSTSSQPRLWSQNGFNLPVTMSCSGAPAGVTFSFFFNPQAPPPDGSVTNDMTISVATSVTPGIYPFQLVGTSGSLVRTFSMQLTVLPSGCSYSLSPIYSDTFTAAGGSSSVTVSTSPTCSWEALTNADWIVITAGSSGVGNGVVNYTVAPNTGAGARLVRMTIAGQTYQIYQLAAACPYSISPTSHSFTAGGWTGVVSVSAPGACFWTATSNASWITVLSASTTNGSGAVTYSVAPNPDPNPRSGTITIAGLAFTVVEAGTGAACAYTISPSEQYCPTGGGSWSTDVNAVSGCAWTAGTTTPWINITGASNGVVSYTVATNPNPSVPRTGAITIADKTLTVFQSVAPTSVNLISFTATRFDNRVLLEWKTGFEVNNLGFKVYRDEAGTRLLVNKEMIAGSALVAGSDVAIEAGQSYAWWDEKPGNCAARSADCPDVAYWLEDIDLSGESVLHGPFLSTRASGDPPARIEKTVLSDLGSSAADIWSSRSIETVSALPRPSSNDDRLQSQVASGQAVKISVRHEGFYHISQPELVRAGLPNNVDPRSLQLLVEGHEVPIIVSTNNGVFDESAAIEFYGIGLDTPSTDQRTYWLIAGDNEGKRINTVSGRGKPSITQSFLQTVERRDRTIYFAALKNGEQENFFGSVITSTPVDQTLIVSHLLASASEPASIEIALQGVTQQSHRTAAYLGEFKLGEISFDNQQQGIARFAVNHSLLREGANTVRLQSVGGPSDISLVDHIRLSYRHTFTADEDRLKLSATGGETVTVGGFTSREIRVLDVTDPDSVSELIGRVDERKDGYAITIAPQGKGERVLLALTNGRQQQAVSIKANVESRWRDRNSAADLVIIASRELFPSLEPLKQQRQSDGLSVAIVDIDDIYDEFNFGNKSVQSVKDFLSFANANWRIQPRFVILAGDSSFDPKNYLRLGSGDIVPTKLVDTAEMETASDDWLVDFNNDGIADVAVGRLPVRSVDESRGIVAKLTGYGLAKRPESSLLISDANDTFDYEKASSNLKPLIDARIKVEELQRGRIDASVAKARLLDALTRGQLIVNYVGHGSANQWRGSLLTSAEARALTNQNLPFMIMMTCLNGYSHDVASDSLAESLLKAEQGGAIAVWASSGVTLPQDQATLNQQLYRLMFDASVKSLTLGEAVMKAKAAGVESDVARTWIFFGDPTMRLR